MALPIIDPDGDIVLSGGEPLLFPRDANHSPSPALMAMRDGTETVDFLRLTDGGRLKIDAAVTIDNVDIGDVNIRVKDIAGSDILVSGGTNPDTLTHFLYNQDQRMTFDTGSLEVKVTSGVTLATPTDIDDGSVASGQESGLRLDLLYGYNGTTWERLLSSTGRLLISGEPPTPPADTFPISDIQDSDVAGTVDTFVTITPGRTLTVQHTAAGAESTISGSKVSMHYDPNGNLVGMTLIEVFFVNGASGGADEAFTTPVGDGTARMVLRRENLTGGNINIFGKWEGFESL